MTVRDELLRAAWYADADAWTLRRVHRLAPLVEYAVLFQQAINSEAVVDALVAERHADLLEELRAARRDAALGWARAAALEVAANDLKPNDTRRRVSQHLREAA